MPRAQALLNGRRAVSGSDREAASSLKETLLMAGSSAATLLLGLARTKLQAVAWGPTGLGALGLFQSAMSTATITTGLGVDSVVTRELARTSAAEELALLRSAATRAVVVMGLAGMAITCVAFQLLASQIGFGSGLDLAIVALGSMLGVVTANQRAVLSGLRHLRRVAWFAVLAAGLATALVAGIVQLPAGWPQLSLSVAVVPLSQAILFGFALLQVPGGASSAGFRESLSALASLARKARLMALAGIVPPLAQFLVRATAHGSLDPISFGCFQAGLSLAALSVSLLASSVGPSVLPRLSAVAQDAPRMSEAISQQISVYLMLFVPVLLMVEALPELVVRALFAPSFAAAVEQVRWQMIGELVRLPCWVMATALTARGRFRAYLAVEITSLVMTTGLVALVAPTGSLALLGVALAFSTVAQFLMLSWLLGSDGIRLTGRLQGQLVVVTGLVAAAVALAGAAPLVRVAMAAAGLVTGGLALRTILRVRRG